MVREGVKSLIADDGLSMTVWAYPTLVGYEDKLSKITWKEYCPVCKKEKTLSLNKENNENGVVKCTCGALYCAISGYQINNKEGTAPKKLITATMITNPVIKVASSQTQSQICELSRATALTKAKSLLKTGSTYKGTLKIPILPNIKLGGLLQLDFEEIPEMKDKILYIDKIKEDIDNQEYTLELIEGKTHYDNPYSGTYITADNKTGKVLNSSSNNPFKATCTKINVNIGLKDNSAIAKKIRLKGQKLGSIKQCYKWLKISSAGGTGGWKYMKYGNHRVSSEKYNTFGELSAKKCWNDKKANCCDFAWLFSMLCKGAGKTVGILSGKYTVFPTGEKVVGHMWNYYGGKRYDCSNNAIYDIQLKQIEKIT